MKWFLVVYFIINAVMTVALVGKPRPSITAGVAAGVLAFWPAS